MSTLPSHLFSMRLTLSDDDVSGRIPMLFSVEYDVRSAMLGEGHEFLAAISRERPTLQSARSLIRAIAKADSRPVVVCSPYLDSGLMKALSSEGIAYIRDEGNVFLPFLGMAASPVPQGRSPRPLSAHAQRIALNLIDGSWDGMTAGELAEAVGVSRSTVSNSLAEIEAILPAAVSSEWKHRVLKNPGMTREELLSAFEDYLVPPVRGKVRLKGRGALEALKRAGAPLAGESALPYYSDLAHNGSVVWVALWRKKLAAAKEDAGPAWVEAEWFEAPDVIVEEWVYEPDEAGDLLDSATGFHVLKATGLYAAMRGEGNGDVRLEDAVAQSLSLAGENDVVLICGSLSYLGQARRIIEKRGEGV